MSTLKVGAIQSATGNAAITIANDGGATLPSQPSITSPIILVAHSNTNVTSSGQRLPFNQVAIDSGSNYDSSTLIFTCPKAGYYEVSFNYLLRNCSNGHRVNVRKNGNPWNVNYDASNAGRSLVWTSASGEINIAASTIVSCAVNDTLDLWIHYLANGDIYGASNVHNQLTIKYLG